MLPSDDQLALRDVAQRFSREKLRPDYQARESQDRIDRALVREMGSLGLIGVDLPEAFGGLGQSGVTAGMIIEDIAYGDFNVSYVQLLASLMGLIMVRNADADLARHWVQGLTSGRLLMGLGLTEPRGGSDAANLALKARKDGNAYVLNGEKASISFSEQADSMVLFARTGDVDEGARGVSAFLVPLDLPGIQRSRYNDVGSRIVGRGSVFFDDVRVPAEYRLGAEGTGFTQVMKGFDYSRVLIALQCIAAAQASIDETWAYIQERQAFGAPLAQYQGVSFPDRRVRDPARRRAAAVLPRAGAARRRPAAHRRGGDGQVDGPEDGLRRDPPVPAELRPLRLVDGPAAPAAAARRDGPGDRRRHGAGDEADRRARTGGQDRRPVQREVEVKETR
jgi:cyclohexanecarboxyl-CoA dehydrogenase